MRRIQNQDLVCHIDFEIVSLFPRKLKAISMNVLMIVQRVSFKLLILYF